MILKKRSEGPLKGALLLVEHHDHHLSHGHGDSNRGSVRVIQGVIGKALMIQGLELTLEEAPYYL